MSLWLPFSSSLYSRCPFSKADFVEGKEGRKGDGSFCSLVISGCTWGLPEVPQQKGRSHLKWHCVWENTSESSKCVLFSHRTYNLTTPPPPPCYVSFYMNGLPLLSHPVERTSEKLRSLSNKAYWKALWQKFTTEIQELFVLKPKKNAYCCFLVCVCVYLCILILTITVPSGLPHPWN